MATPEPNGTAAVSWAAARRARVAAARESAAAFAEFVLCDEQTGKPVRLAPMHREWCRLADAHRRLVILAHVESGKSQALAVARTLWLLGRDPNKRIVVVSNTHGQASKVLRSIRGYLERSAELREVFPHLKPATPWTDSQLTVQRTTNAKDPSVQAFGVHGNVLGARIDHLILDDVVDFENARTPEQRDLVQAWYDSTLATRLTEDARVIVVGTPFHPEDVYHRFSVSPAWETRRFPVEDDAGNPSWPERWSRERVADRRRELGAASAARNLDCVARSDEDSRFKDAWIQTALARGDGKRALPHLLHVPEGCRTFTGVDLAVSKSSSADLTAFVTVLSKPNGDRELLSVESGRFSGPEIVERILNIHRRFQSTFIVESVAAQAFISQFVRRLAAIRVIDFKTGRDKMSLEWQTEALAAEFERGQWVIPSDGGLPNDPEVSALLREASNYDPRSHTGDRLAALCFSRWGCELGSLKVVALDFDVTRR